MKQPLYIFLHIPKSGGTTIRKHIQKNFSPQEAVLFERQDLRFSKKTSKYSVYMKEAQDYFGALDQKALEEIQIIYGHEVPYGIHTLFDRPCRYITVFREPISRTISHYNFFLTRYNKEDDIKKNQKPYPSILLVNNKVPSFTEWIEKVYAHLTVETMSQLLELLGYMNGNHEKAIQEAVNRFYFIGLTDRLDEDAAFIYDLLGIKTYFINQNISQKHASEFEIQKAMPLLKQKNKSDLILYKATQKHGETFRLNHPEFDTVVRKVQSRKKFLLPFSQLLLDSYETLYRVSSYIKERVPLYGKLLTLVRKTLHT